MPEIFNKLDELKPVYDWLYKFLMLICKLLLIADIAITCLSVGGRYFNKWIPFWTDPAWSEEIVLTLMAYMAVLSAALAIRRRAHIRLTAFDAKMSKKAVKILDLISDLAVMGLAIVMLVVGMKYAISIGTKGTYVSLPSLSKFWMYFPVPIAGIFMIIFELECIEKDIRAFYEKDDGPKKEEEKK